MLRSLAVIASIVSVAAACGSAPPAGSSATTPTPTFAGQTVTSSDGKATLGIPSGALPAGLNASGITIAPEPAGDLLAAYDLQPSGSQFSSPLQLTVQTGIPPATNNDDGAIPMLVNSGDTYDVATDQQVSIDMGAGTASVSGGISHFSHGYVMLAPASVTILGFDASGERQENIPPQAVGVSFPVRGFLSIGGPGIYVSTLDDGTEIVAKASAATVFKLAWTAGPFLSPATQTETPPLFQPDWIQQQYDRSFTCSQATSSTWLDLSAQLSWTGKLLEFKKDNPENSQNQQPGTGYLVGNDPDRTVEVTNSVINVTVRTNQFGCGAALPTGAKTPTPSPKPTPSSPPTPMPYQSIGPYDISGMCFKLVRQPPPPHLVFTLYWYGRPITDMTITADGISNGQPTAMNFDSTAGGFVDVPLPLTGDTVKIKKVTATGEGGVVYDLTPYFIQFLGQDTLNIEDTGDQHWGTICQ